MGLNMAFRDPSTSPRGYYGEEEQMFEEDRPADDLEYWYSQSEEHVRRKIIQLAEEIELEMLQKKQSKHAKSEMSVMDAPFSMKSSSVPDEFPAAVEQCDSDETCFPVHQDSRKRRLCRHFLKGHCKRGNSCDFLHDNSIFCPDGQKVFLGGLPAHITADDLISSLAEMGFNVINKPKVLRGFTPQVCLSTLDQARRLIAMGKICIEGALVDVRPYEDKKPNEDIKCSIFLGGLPNGMSTSDLKMELALLGIKVKNHPIMKVGFTPQVVVGSPMQAQMLIRAKKLCLSGKMVDVRPYVNFRKRY